MTTQISNVKIGLDGEIEVQKILEANGFVVAPKSSYKSPYDLLVDGLLRVDVKTATYKKTETRVVGWNFCFGKRKQSDIYALFKSDDKDVYFIPWHAAPERGITIGEDGHKYDKYRNRFDLVRSMVDTRRKEADAV